MIIDVNSAILIPEKPAIVRTADKKILTPAMASFLPGMFPHGGIIGGANVASGLYFLSSSGDNTNITTYTFSGVNIGTPANNRRIIVAATSFEFSEKSISSITIGGIPATLHLNLNSASTVNDTDLAIGSCLVPTGTTADIVVTHNTTANACSIGVWALYGETSSSPFATASDISLSGATLSTTIDIPSSGALVAACAAARDTITGVAWTGATEQFDASLISDTLRYSGASENALGVESGRTVQAVFDTTPSANSGLLGVISWQFA